MPHLGGEEILLVASHVRNQVKLRMSGSPVAPVRLYVTFYSCFLPVNGSRTPDFGGLRPLRSGDFLRGGVGSWGGGGGNGRKPRLLWHRYT